MLEANFNNIIPKEGVSEDILRHTLIEIGLTEQEIKVYIFLVKKGPSRAIEISKANSQTKLQIYRNLKNLQKKGVVECTFNHPAYFSAISLNKLLEGFVKTKEEEATGAKIACKIVLNNIKTDPSIMIESADMFTVIEDRSRIYSKAKQMLKEAKSKVRCMEVIANQFDADQTIESYRSEAVKRLFNKKIDFKEIFYVANWNYHAAIKPIEFIYPKANVELRHIDLHPLDPLSFPRICIKDDDEILVFVSPKIKGHTTGKDEKALWTNNKSIIYVYVNFWENLWQKSASVSEILQNPRLKALTKT